MKFFRKLFSKTALVSFLILFQLAVLVGIVVLAMLVDRPIAAIISAVIWIFAAVLILVILNRKEAPDFKIPWILVIALVPVLGIFIWLLFRNKPLRKKDSRRFSETLRQISESSNWAVSDDDKLKMSADKYYGTFKYLIDTASSKAYFNSRITYYPTGEEFFPEFMKSLEEAEKFIFLEFFIIDYGEEWDAIHEILKRKAAEGIDVRLMYDDIGCGGTLKRKFKKTLIEEGIKCINFNPFRPILSGIFNNRDHRKIAVIDHKYAWTGGINLADEYANKKVRFGYWKDVMVKVQGPAISEFLEMYLVMFDSYVGVRSNYKELLKDDYPRFESDSITAPFGDGPAPYAEELIGEQTIINLISSAEKSVYISTPYLIPTYNLISAIKNAAYRGVDIRILVPGVPDKKIVYLMAKGHFLTLHKAGVKISVYKKGFNHAKAIVVDNKIAFVGTINLDYRSLVHHFECGVVFYKSQAVSKINEDLLSCFEESEYFDGFNFGLKPIQKLFCVILNIFAPLL